MIDENRITTYIEPFVGGANMIDKIHCANRWGNDIHKQLIALFNHIQTGWRPPEHISEDEYNNVRLNKECYPDWYVGFVGFNATFGSKYFGGYARGFKADKTTPRDIPNEAIRNLINQIPSILDVKFTSGNYLDIFKDVVNAVIYCDPPYEGTTKYSTENFNHQEYWDWVRHISKNNIVLCSEYNAPDDFKCIWSKSVTTSLKVKEHEDRVEKLFIYRN